MVILREATIKYKGYDPNTLTKGSHKRVCISCDECGRVRWQSYKRYQNLCVSCSNKINKHNLGKHLSNETKAKISKGNKGKTQSKEARKKNSISNKGRKVSYITRIKKSCSIRNILIKDFDGFTIKRKHLTPTNQCIKLNKKFNKSCGHHLTSSIIIYIPEYLHRSVSHNMKTNKNMNKINKLAMDYLVGGI